MEPSNGTLSARQVIQRARRGEGLESIEADIEDADLDEESKAALWLAAFVERQRGEQRYIARQSLILAGHTQITPAGD